MIRHRSAIFRAFLLIVCFTVLATSACNRMTFHKVYPVSGRILVNGEPAFEALIYLHRTWDDDHPRRVTPVALTDVNGEFKITSYFTDDGAPEGEYIITIEWRERSGLLKNQFEGIDRLGGAYSSKTTNEPNPGFKINVAKTTNVLPDFNLTQSPEAKKKHEEWKKKPPRSAMQ